eukprot:4351-Eustigmatos_ZCMA.PRE.1
MIPKGVHTSPLTSLEEGSISQEATPDSVYLTACCTTQIRMLEQTVPAGVLRGRVRLAYP